MDPAVLEDLKKAMIAKAVIKVEVFTLKIVKVQDSDMNPEMQAEVQDVIVSGIENNSAHGFNVEVIVLIALSKSTGCLQVC